MTRPATLERNHQRYLTAAKVGDLADAIPPRFRAMVMVAAHGGLSFGELAALRRKRVDPLNGRVVAVEALVDVNDVLTFGPTKTRSGRRTVPLPRHLPRGGGARGALRSRAGRRAAVPPRSLRRAVLPTGRGARRSWRLRRG